MRVIVLGRSGQLARCLAETSPGPIFCLGRSELDLSLSDINTKALGAAQPDLVINAAAYTAVDQAETQPQAAFALNARAPARIAEFCEVRGIPLIHISTDYVFDGRASRPYTESDETAPINVYGQSKLEGEQAVAQRASQYVIVRTSWLYSAYGMNFVKTMLRLGKERKQLRIVADQVGRPTSAHQLARVIWRIAEQLRNAPNRFPWGIYHYADIGEVSWAGFAQLIFATAQDYSNERPDVVPITTEQFPTAAARPRYSVLNTAKLQRVFQVRSQPFQESLRDVLLNLKEGAAA